jgi:hypothetical protein
MFDPIEHQADGLVEEANPQSVASIAWSVAILGLPS